MKGSQFIRESYLTQLFGSGDYRRLLSIITEIRRVWPDFPDGRERIEAKHAARFIYVASCIEKVSQVPDVYIKGTRLGVYQLLQEIIESKDKARQIESVKISSITGQVSIVNIDGALMKIPEMEYKDPEQKLLASTDKAYIFNRDFFLYLHLRIVVLPGLERLDKGVAGYIHNSHEELMKQLKESLNFDISWKELFNRWSE